MGKAKDGTRRSIIGTLVFSTFVGAFLALVVRNVVLQRQIWTLRSTRAADYPPEPLVPDDAILRLSLRQRGTHVAIEPLLTGERTIILMFNAHCPSCLREKSAWEDYRRLYPTDSTLLVREGPASSAVDPTNESESEPQYEAEPNRFLLDRLSKLPQILVVDRCGIVRAVFRTVGELEKERPRWSSAEPEQGAGGTGHTR
jgi:hypothetical protein